MSTQYRLEAVKEPGIPLDLDLVLGEVDVREFRAFECVGATAAVNFDEIEHHHHRRGKPSHLHDSPPTPNKSRQRDVSLPDMFSIEAPLYKEFVVKALHKLSKGVDVSLAVSGQKVDMNPFPGIVRTSTYNMMKRSWTWHPKAVSIPIENVADCLVVKASEYINGHEVD